ATAWMLREMAARGKAPLALLLNFANPIMAQGAAFGGIPLMDRFEGDVTALIRSGDRLRVIPARGEVIITRG
ncbi:MAG: aconitase X swivel domain-containing protein, partial [Burkholderiales bacterium]